MRTRRLSAPIAALVLAGALVHMTAQRSFATDEIDLGDHGKKTKAEVKHVMSYNGYLTDAAGEPITDGSYRFTFSIYAAASGGTALWSEIHDGVAVHGGSFHVFLGQGTPAADLNLPFDQPYFLAVRVNGGEEMTPRIELATAAYAFRSLVADKVPNGSITNEKIAPGAVTDDKIADVDWAKLTNVPEVPGQTPPGRYSHKPMKSSHWSIWGNIETDSTYHYIGTADYMALVFRTNNQEAMRISEDGEVGIKSDLSVGRDLYVGRDAHVGRNITVEDTATVNRSLFVNPGENPSFSVTEGGQVIIKSTEPASQSNMADYPLLVDAQDQGMAIKTKGTRSAVNNYVSFWDDNGMVGRIEGQDASDVLLSAQYILETALTVAELALRTADFTAAVTSTHPCTPTFTGACIAPTIPSWNVKAIVGFGIAATKEVARQAFFFNNLGVGYASSSGDYAESLLRIDPAEKIDAGDIVGVFGGRVTRSTRDAEQLLVVSRAPIVLGNVPEKDKEDLYEKVAFIGQVMVRVMGPVNDGDYIIPSGFDDGTGIAVAPEMMTADEFTRVVGRAWDSASGPSINHVNVAVGLNAGDVSKVLVRQQRRIERLESEVGRVHALDAKVTAMQRALETLMQAAESRRSSSVTAAGTQ